MTTDPRIVASIRCSWWDSIDRAGQTDSDLHTGIPCCPYCESPLLQWENQADFDSGIPGMAAENSQTPEHTKRRLDWLRGVCIQSLDGIELLFAEHQVLEEISAMPCPMTLTPDDNERVCRDLLDEIDWCGACTARLALTRTQEAKDNR